MPTITYIYDKPTNTWRRNGAASISPEPSQEEDDTVYRPVSYASVEEAREALGAPDDATYVVWDHGDSDLWSVLKTLGSNDILVLPERDEPYYIDSSRGFMASGVAEVDGPDGTRVSIVNESGLWFEMARAKRGIIGMGPGVVIQTSESDFSFGQQPANGEFLAYRPDGTVLQSLSSASFTVLGNNHTSPFFANFIARSQGFGGCAYSFLGTTSTSGGISTVKRIYFDGCWRGHLGLPNGEAAAIGFLRGEYLIENCDLRAQEASSPVMWNRNSGGTVRNVRSSRPSVGMWTWWKCGGVNTLENCIVHGKKVTFNLEENQADGIGEFTLNITGGELTLDGTETGTRAHFNIFPSANLSDKITLQDVVTSGNGYTPDHTVAHIWGTSPAGSQKKSDVIALGTTPAMSHVPASSWGD